MAYIGYLRMIAAGLAGGWQELKRILRHPPHRIAIKTWLAVWSAGLATAVGCSSPWPFTILGVTLALAADYVSIRILFACAEWFYVKGRQYEISQPKRRRRRAT